MVDIKWKNRTSLFSVFRAFTVFVIVTSCMGTAYARSAKHLKSAANGAEFGGEPIAAGGGSVRPINVITLEKEPVVSGARIEPVESEDPSFVGYKSKGVNIVTPDVEFHYVLFGFWLDELHQIGFTSTNCSNAEYLYDQTDFLLQTDKRVVLRTAFALHETDIKLCIKAKAKDKDDEPVFSEVIEHRTWVSTVLPPRQYYFNLYLQIAIVAFLLVLSGLFSGLNLGLMALTPQELVLIQKSGSKTERKYAETILPVRARGNQLLCSLLIGNVCVNSAISILMDDLTSGYIALFAASAGIVVFGEIFPQSLCVKKGLAVGAHTIFITRFFIMLTFPLAWPISKILDYILGEEVVAYDRKRLMELIKMNAIDENGLAEELKIAVGAMEISDKTVADVMTKIDDVFMLPDTTILNTRTVAEILTMGYTRIPVYTFGDRDQVVALLFVKDLALLDPDDNFTITTVASYHAHVVRFVMEDTPLRVMLDEFKEGDYHLAIVQKIRNDCEDEDPKYVNVGVCTLEDIVEEIIQAEIIDETDAILDNVQKKKRGKKQRDLSYLINHDHSACVISVQMQLVTMQWLTTNVKAFHQDLISQSVMEKLIRQHVRKVELTHLPAMYDPRAVVPRNAKLYSKGDPSDKFILILEGRALVTIGQDAMTFEAGPWHTFGAELLDRVVEELTDDNPVSQSRSSLAIGEERKPHKLNFIPDFSVAVRDDCTFLEISVSTYLLAYKTTMIGKEKEMISEDDEDVTLKCLGFKNVRPSITNCASPSARSPLLNGRAASQASIDTSALTRNSSYITPQSDLLNRIKHNGNGVKKRSVSESEQVELLSKVDFLSPRDPSLFSEDSTLSDN